MMLELSYGYPDEISVVKVGYDGAAWFFWQNLEGKDSEVVLADESCGKLVKWLNKISTYEDHYRRPEIVIEGGDYKGVLGQSNTTVLWKFGPHGEPVIGMIQESEEVWFDADEAKYLAVLLAIKTVNVKILMIPLLPRPVRPQDVIVKCPVCPEKHGQLMSFPHGQNEVRCKCGFAFSFRYTPDMTEGA